jgi:hypothetical protein
MRRESWLKICAKADLYLNLSGGCWLWRDEYAAIPYSAFIDSDPAFTQLLIAEGGSWQETFFPKFNRLFTFGRNIGTSDSPVPTGSLSWEHTWQPICPDEWTSSLGEFSVAKNTYVRTNSGWFSDRTECYLASGRPAVVQDTGFSSHLPVKEGLFSYKTIDEAKESIDEVLRNYKRHSLAARELALSHFAYQIILPPLLERATTKTESI